MTDWDEAKVWLATATRAFEDESLGRARYTVVVAQSIHALIRANDAPAVRFLRRRSTRHEDAALLFGELVRSRKILPQHARLRPLLIRTVSEKSEYDYKGTEVSRAMASRWLRNAESFLAAVHDIPR